MLAKLYPVRKYVQKHVEKHVERKTPTAKSYAERHLSLQRYQHGRQYVTGPKKLFDTQETVAPVVETTVNWGADVSAYGTSVFPSHKSIYDELLPDTQVAIVPEVVKPEDIIREVKSDLGVQDAYRGKLEDILNNVTNDTRHATGYLQHAFTQWHRKRNNTRVVTDETQLAFKIASEKSFDDDLQSVSLAQLLPENIVKFVHADGGFQEAYAEELRYAVEMKDPQKLIDYLANAYQRWHSFKHYEVHGERFVLTPEYKEAFLNAAKEKVGESIALRLALSTTQSQQGPQL